jgi:predicted RecA/RadA family phage recombinase
MKNFVQDGDVITVPAPADVTSGKLVVIGSLVGVAQKAAVIGADLPLLTKGVVSYAKTSALAIAIGDKVYYDATNNVVNKTASGNTLVGVAVSVAANPSPRVDFKLGPTTV